MVDHPHDPVLQPAQMHVVLPGAPVMATIKSSDSCMRGKSASFVRHIAVDLTGTKLEGTFLAGQSFGVIPPGDDPKGRPHKVRLYSIASPSYGEDGFGRVISTTCKRTIEEGLDQYAPERGDGHPLLLGVCSNFLCDQPIGAPVSVSGPNGKRFVLPVDINAHDYFFFATGTGIAPFRGMVHELLVGPPEGSPWRARWKGPCARQIHLLMGAPYTTDLLYDDWFRGLASKHANFHYHTVISREQLPAPDHGPHVHHYLEARLSEFRGLIAAPTTLFYMCGLAGMQVGLFHALGKAGLGDGYLTIHEELTGIAAESWTTEQIKRRVRPTHRCMLEVY
jgi:ferredoxin--NADP+ reductase